MSPAIVEKPSETRAGDRDREHVAPIAVEPGYPGFVDLCARVGFALEPFQRRIARLVFEGRREVLILLPRGQGKTCLQALVALHHLLTVEDAEIFCCASSRDQAKILYQYAARFARELDHPNVVHRHLELRWCPDPSEPTDFTRYLRVLPAEAPRLYGLTPSLMFLDEYQALTDDEVYVALSSALHKRPDAKLIVVSTAGQGAGSPLGRLRARALGLPDVRRKGFVTEAKGPDLAMLEWAVPDDAKITPSVVKRANPGSWIGRHQISAARDALPELAYRRFVANQWTAKVGAWLPSGSWQACAGEVEVADGDRIWVGVDVGGERSDSAVVWVTEDLDVGCEVFEGAEAVVDVAEFVPVLAERYQIVECVFDPWRAQQMAREWEQRGVSVSEFQQYDRNMIPASQQLYDAVVEGKLTHPDDERLNRHVAAAVARHGRRGWRLDKADDSEPIDGVVALCMALAAKTAPGPEPVKFLGWL
jgi:phage terminase large subunit-like protein